MLFNFKIRYLLFTLLSVFFFSFSTTEKDIELTEDEWVESILGQLTLEERIGQLFLVKYSSLTSNSDKRKLFKLLKSNKIGGVNFKNFLIEELKNEIDSVKSFSQKVPLYLSFDEHLESLSSSDSLIIPSNFSLATANDEKVAELNQSSAIQLYKKIGFNLQLGINANIDEASNPKYTNSLGTNPLELSRLIKGIIKGSNTFNFSTSIGLFPGYNSQDSQGLKENKTPEKSFDAVDLQAYRQSIDQGVKLIQVGNYKVNVIDSVLPLTISTNTKKYFEEKLKYKELLITDDLSNPVLESFGKEHEIALKAYKAGFDLIYGVENVEKSIKTIELAILNDSLQLEELNNRVRKILRHKYKSILKNKKSETSVSVDSYYWGKKAVYEKGFVVAKNNEAFPLGDLTKKYLHVSIGAHSQAFSNGLDRFKDLKHLDFYTIKEAQEKLKNQLSNYDYVLISIHLNARQNQDFSYSEFSKWLNTIPSKTKKGIVLFGSPANYKSLTNLESANGLVLAFENNNIVQEQISQFIFGAVPCSTKLPFDINEHYQKGSGLEVAYGGRPKFATLAELNMSSNSLSKIDSIVSNSIKDKVFPGCQIFVSVGGKIAFNKGFGHPTYEDSVKVTNQHIYDIASVTKIAASTLVLMYLESQGRFSIDKKLNDYLPELVGNTKMATIELREMMAHQAGLPAWIPFYYKTLKGGKLDTTLYSNVPKDGFRTQVTKDLWIMDSYADTIYKKIVRANLQEKTYVYSDLGYYFIKKIVEKITSQPYDQFLQDSIYMPMGLNKVKYKPSLYFDLAEIIPTENDLSFRHKLIHGFVHDPGAAMLGGVGGHAGLFSTATDLAGIMHLFMNNGNYGGIQYLKPEVVKRYTSCQYCPTNRRGIGFDRPQNSGGGTCDKVCSQSSYGHSGFTGTLVWNDPKYQIVYVFLSNRVYPDAENWKIVKQSVRTNIQRVIYDAVLSAEKNKIK